MKKLEKIDKQEQQTRDKIAALQAILKKIDGARTEQENLQIVQKIRALKLSRDELYAFLGGDLPAALTGALGGADTAAVTAEPETIYTRRDRKRKNEPPDEPGEETPDNDAYGETNQNDGDTPNNESEGMNNENV